MQKRKLQIFLSSTYDDLVGERLAAMEAILAAGHIPAAMEQFPPGDETALERIQSWIEESDAFVLIIGGRYGSIESVSGKSYVQLEYEYAFQKKKPFFALVVTKEHHEQRVKQHGLAVDEREHQGKYKEFKAIVTQNCVHSGMTARTWVRDTYGRGCLFSFFGVIILTYRYVRTKGGKLARFPRRPRTAALGNSRANCGFGRFPQRLRHRHQGPLR
jgi:hypothetical protein